MAIDIPAARGRCAPQAAEGTVYSTAAYVAVRREERWLRVPCFGGRPVGVSNDHDQAYQQPR